MIEIAIFTRQNNEKLQNLIKDINNQSLENFKIKIYSDKYFELPNTKIIETKNKNISEKRNLAIQNSNSKYLFLLDDDNRIYDKKFLEKLLSKYKILKEKYGEVIVSPTIYWRNTKKIQSSGIKFCYLLGKVFANHNKVNNYKLVKAIGGNSLFSETDTFKKEEFDEKIGFIGEDIDYCYSIRKKGVKIAVISEKINHQERDKNSAEKSFIQGKAYKTKIRNRDRFVNKHGNLFQKIMFWGFGRWVSIFIWNLKLFGQKIKRI